MGGMAEQAVGVQDDAARDSGAGPDIGDEECPASDNAGPGAELPIDERVERARGRRDAGEDVDVSRDEGSAYGRDEEGEPGRMAGDADDQRDDSGRRGGRRNAG